MYGVGGVIMAAVPQADGGAGAFAIGDFWGLTQQAGPLRWPIFFVLAFGMIQVFMKLYELIRDRRVSTELASADLATMSLEGITALVAKQQESMLATLQSTMVNVFQTRPGEGLLHDEISNFVVFQQDQFSSFRRRMEFLSDTAGALGLMGTVWGMFTVFFQGTAEQDVILRGMGIALITTLLGLVVSIILNFSATELSTFFGKRLDAVSRKSDELRFRLMELAPTPEPVDTAAIVRASVEAVAARQADSSGAGAAKPPATRPTKKKQKPVVEETPPSAPVWHYVEVDGGPYRGVAGDRLGGVTMMVRDRGGSPAAGIPVLITAVGSGGGVGDGARTLRLESGEGGALAFDCSLPEQAGTFTLEASLPNQPGTATRVEVQVGAAKPARMDVEGNNQAAVAGMRLPLPLGVRLFDEFDNPVVGVDVDFVVEQGEGRLSEGNGASKVKTGVDGLAAVPFVVSGSAGQNVVTASVAGTDHQARFIAFGTEV